MIKALILVVGTIFICSARVIIVPVQDLQIAETAQFGYGGYENGYGGGGFGGAPGYRGIGGIAPYRGYGGEYIDSSFGIPGLGGIEAGVNFNPVRGGLII